jgi:hypothetical protein
MKKLYLLLLVCFAQKATVFSEGPLFSALLSKCIKNIERGDKRSSRIVSLSLSSFNHLYHEKNSINDFFADKNIQDLFLLSHSEKDKNLVSVDNSSSQADLDIAVLNTQKLMLARLYIQFFGEYIKKAELILQEISAAKEYWKKELFCESLPWTRKNITRWSTQKTYSNLLRFKIQALQEAEDQISSILGLALYGRYQISQINSIYNISACLSCGALNVYNHFNAPFVEIGSPIVDSYRLFKDAWWFSQSATDDLEKLTTIVDEHKKPHHVVRHKVAYSVLAGSIIMAMCAYKKYEEHVPFYKQKSKDVFDNFIQEYIVDAAVAAKKFFWDQNRNVIGKINKMDPLPTRDIAFPHLSPKDPLPMVDNKVATVGGFIPVRSHNDLNEHQKVVNQNIQSGIQDYNNVIDSVNRALEEYKEIKQTINQNKEEAVLVANNLFEVINQNSRATLFMVAVLPTVGGGYLGYRSVNAVYNRFIKHETWYKPMRMLVRSIDIILNKIISTKERSFRDDGKLHILIIQLRSYIYCLSSEELFLFQDDISQLLSFDLSYEQKHRVLERMHRTYEFLK